MANLKRPLTKNFYLSLTGKEPVLNNFTLYNNFPIGLMIISILDPTSCRGKEYSDDNDNSEEVEIKVKYMNQQASDLFEIKDNDSISKIHQQLKLFKKFDQLKTSEENLDNILFNKNRENEFYGSFKNQASLIYVKYKTYNDDLYICTDYYTDEKKIIQNQLFQSLKFQYIATLFHELYNPINALLFIIDTNQNEEENKDEIKSNLGNKNNFSEMDESQFSSLTENDYNKNNSNAINNENSSTIKNRKIDDFYKHKLSVLYEKEKDMSLLVNMIYIFLQNLILYLRINLGVNFNHNESQQKKDIILQNENNKNDNDSKNIKIDNNKEEEKNNEINNQKNENIYSDNYLTCINKNKKINLELSFYKHLNKFSYLFNFKNIQYCNDFSYLSDKYIFTDESVFFDFLGQIYTFLYYVVPKSQGFEISYSLINDNKLKIIFHKTNFLNKGGYRIKKMRKNNSVLICEDKFKATSTVKTPEMTQEILYKLSEILGIKLKIMEYEDQKEDKYLTIIMPFFIDEDNDILDSDIDELPDDNFGKIPYLGEVVARNILYDDNEKSDIEEIKNNNINIIIDNNNNNNENTSKLKSLNINNNNNNNLNKKPKSNPNYLNPNFYKFTPERKASFLVDEVEEKNSSEEDVSSQKEDSKDKENENENNKNYLSINQNKYNKNNNINCSSISKSSVNNGGCISLISNSQKLSLYKSKSPMSDKNFTHLKISNFKDLSNNYLNEVKPFLIKNDVNCSKDAITKETPNLRANTNIKLKRNPLTLIHQKYSTLERLKASGVEILKEKESQNISNNKKKPFCLESIDLNDDNTNLKDKKSINVEADSDNYFEIENENEDEEDIENGFNNYLNIENNNKNGIIKHNNSFLLNINYINNNVFFNSSPKHKFPSNKPSNKTLDYNKQSKKNLFVLQEMKQNDHKKSDSKLSKMQKIVVKILLQIVIAKIFYLWMMMNLF